MSAEIKIPRGSICPSCGSAAAPKVYTRGSLLVELFLWLCFLLPGMIYSAWRLSTRYRACRRCGSAMIPIRSPRGWQICQQYYTIPTAAETPASSSSGSAIWKVWWVFPLALGMLIIPLAVVVGDKTIDVRPQTAKSPQFGTNVAPENSVTIPR